MSLVTIWSFVKQLIPSKKIGAWILGVIAAVVALVMGINTTDLKAQFCANEVVTLPKIEIAAPVAPIVPEVKK
jgi:hypothetical protein